MVTATPPNREAELSALKRAIAVERRARYADFQGKRSTFSQFMRRTAESLCRRFPIDSRWATIRALFRNYTNLDVATRIAILHRVEELLNQPDGEESIACVASVDPIPVPKTSHQKTVASEDGKKQWSRPHKSKSPEVETENSRTLSEQSGGSQSGKTSHVSTFDIKNESQGGSRGQGKELLAARSPSNKSEADNPKLQQAPDEVDVKFVRGVGPKNAELLNNLGIYTVSDLLRHYPRRHLDFQNRLMIRDIKPGQEVTIIGTIRSVGAFQSKRSNLSIVTVVIHDGSGSVSITRFIGGKSSRYLLDRYKDQFPKGAQVLASGTVEFDRYQKRYQLKNAEVELLGVSIEGEPEFDSLHAGRLVPVYPLTEGLSLRRFRGMVYNALETYGQRIEDYLPALIKSKYELIDRLPAIIGIHFPDQPESKDLAQRRLVFDELFAIQLQLAYRRHHLDVSEPGLALNTTAGGLLANFRANLPFTLTGAQERVFREISRDLAADKPMHRLVQGDVGSGKTVVAIMAFLVAIENGFQGAMMVPTEILAEQHYRQLQKFLTPLGLRCALLLGKQGQKERRGIQQDLSSGQIHVVVGTHALIQEQVEFKNLGLIIIDEQHRFGVKQRATLKAKGQNPELLTMTATPIPRTLALTLHGDLDVSEIDELPPGRKPVATRSFAPRQKDEVWKLLRAEIDKGRQAYIVFPLIEESETLAAKAATAEYEKLSKDTFSNFRVGLMHGKLKPDQKEAVMEKFRQGELQILVSTTVIEVGVDVPNASVMVIENADRFGLAQLHQLRGRVGRGAEQSYCFLISDMKSETTRQRLDIMTQTNDGFVVAERDLQLRGPGEFLGTKQSGLPDLFLADLVRDAKTLEQARHAAIDLIKQDPELSAYPGLLEQVKRHIASMEATDYLGSG